MFLDAVFFLAGAVLVLLWWAVMLAVIVQLLVQFNVLDTETLKQAQAAPESHRDLVVRVAGYSAFWVELSPVVQDEIISRTEQCM